VVVPDEVAGEPHELELVVVHLGDDLRRPLFLEQPELVREIDRAILMGAPLSIVEPHEARGRRSPHRHIQRGGRRSRRIGWPGSRRRGASASCPLVLGAERSVWSPRVIEEIGVITAAVPQAPISTKFSISSQRTGRCSTRRPMSLARVRRLSLVTLSRIESDFGVT